MDEDLELSFKMPDIPSDNGEVLATLDLDSLANLADDWCPPCQQCVQYKKEIEKMKEDHKMDFEMLKQKIISTDLLIKQFNAKRKECDKQTKRLKDAEKKLEKSERTCKTLHSQLQAALKEVEPLKKAKIQLEKEKHWAETHVESVRDKFQASEAAIKQYKDSKANFDAQLTDALEKKLTSEKALAEFKSSFQKKESLLKKVQNELTQKKTEFLEQRKELNKLKPRLVKAEEQVKAFSEILGSNGLLPKGFRASVWSKTSCDREVFKQPAPPPLPVIPKVEPPSISMTRHNHAGLLDILKSCGCSDSEDSVMGDLLLPLSRPLSPLPQSPARAMMSMDSDSSSADEGCDADVEELAGILENELNDAPPPLKPHLKATTVMATSLSAKTLCNSEKHSGTSVEHDPQLKARGKRRKARLIKRESLAASKVPAFRKNDKDDNASRINSPIIGDDKTEIKSLTSKPIGFMGIFNSEIVKGENLSDSDTGNEDNSETQLPFQNMISVDERSNETVRGVSPITSLPRRGSEPFFPSQVDPVQNDLLLSSSDSETEKEAKSGKVLFSQGTINIKQSVPNVNKPVINMDAAFSDGKDQSPQSNSQRQSVELPKTSPLVGSSNCETIKQNNTTPQPKKKKVPTATLR